MNTNPTSGPWEVEDGTFTVSAPDTLENLPSHHCAVDGPDIKERLRQSQPAGTTGGYLLADAADRIEALEKKVSQLAEFGKAAAAIGVDCIESIERQLAEASKGHAMYEHVRTLNPRDFADMWTENVCGGMSFDDLVLADMDKQIIADTRKQPEIDPRFAAAHYGNDLNQVVDIKEMLSEHLSMSKFVNAGDMYAEMNRQRKEAAKHIATLESEAEQLRMSWKNAGQDSVRFVLFFESIIADMHDTEMTPTQARVAHAFREKGGEPTTVDEIRAIIDTAMKGQS